MTASTSYRTFALLFCLLAMPVAAQELPTPEPLFVTAGGSPRASVGQFVAGVGDVNGDGYADALVGAGSTLSVFSGDSGQLLYTIFAVQQGDFEDASVLPVPDVDGDEVGDFLVGAPRVVLSGQRDAGVLYLFSGAGGYGLRALAGPGPQLRQEFGRSLALLDDMDGDGFPEVAVGAPGARTVTKLSAGSVSILSLARGRILHVIRGADAGMRMGAALAQVADLDGDGRSDLAVGAPGADAAEAAGAGAIHLFSTRTGDRLGLISGERAGGRFGAALALAGDLDGDGRSDLLAGAPGSSAEDPTAAGEAWVLSPRDGRRLLHLPGPVDSVDFGAVVAGGQDYDGDGRPDLLIGAPHARVEERVDAGLAQVLSGGDGRVLLSLTGGPGDTLGAAVAFAGDLNADGRADVLVGAPFHDLLAVPDVGAAMALAQTR
jgi:hypothetical protein